MKTVYEENGKYYTKHGNTIIECLSAELEEIEDAKTFYPQYLKIIPLSTTSLKTASIRKPAKEYSFSDCDDDLFS